MIITRRVTLVLVPQCANVHGGRATAVTFEAFDYPPGYNEVSSVTWPCGCTDDVEAKLRQVLGSA